jgi:hypothetical protein
MTMRTSRIAFVLPLLLTALPTSGDTSFTGTGWLTGVPVAGILCTNGSGQVYLNGNVHTLRVMADDTRVTGRLEAMPHVAFLPDGTRQFTGRAYSEVGTWDTAGTTFTPSGGVWDLSYGGVTQVDGSIHYEIAGYGIGGNIDGLRAEITANRGPGASFDPAISYAISGTIKPAPVNTTVSIDVFDDGEANGWDLGAGGGLPGITETDGRLTLDCDWTGIKTSSNPVLTLAWAGHDQAWAASDAQTVELRTDLVALNPAADSAALAFAVQQGGPNYVLFKGHTWLMLFKQNGAAYVFLCGSHIVTPDTGVVMSLALTKVGQNLVLTGRILEKAAPSNVLGQLSFLDTPDADAVLSSQEVADLIGGPVSGFGPDPGAFWTTGQRAWLGVWQYTDGTEPPAQVAFDNVQFRTYDVPPIGIERAVRISFPDLGGNGRIEAASDVQGPYLPVQFLDLPGMKTLTLPVRGPTRFIRVHQAP